MHYSNVFLFLIFSLVFSSQIPAQESAKPKKILINVLENDKLRISQIAEVVKIVPLHQTTSDLFLSTNRVIVDEKEDCLFVTFGTFPISYFQYSADPTAVFYSHSNNKTYFYYPSSLIEPITRDTLFIFEHNVMIPVYKLRFEEQLYELNRTQKFDREKPPFKKFRINSVFVSSSFLFCSYSVESNYYFFCYDIKNDKSYNMPKGFNDDFYNTGNTLLKHFNFETNRMFFVKDGIEVGGKVKNVDENSNPVLFIVYLKE